MSPQALPPRVLAFLAAHIAGIDHLQLLMRLVATPDRWWDAAAMARELGIPERTARDALDHLARHNLLDIRVTGDVRYQYCAGTAELEAAVTETTEAFRRRPIDVIDAVTGGRRRGLRDFSNAFRIRRDDDR
jgi:hypothetical protein